MNLHCDRVLAELTPEFGVERFLVAQIGDEVGAGGGVLSPG